MPRIGQLLVRADLVSENNLSRALGVQNFAGGRIGTLLLERGSVNEDDLGKTLGLQHGCEYISGRVLDEILPVTIAALPAKFAIKHGVIPYDRGESYLKIVLRDPGDLRILDELFFVTGRKIIAAVSPEVRIYQALEKYYGERRTPRFAILAEKLSRLTRQPGAGRLAPPPPPEFFKQPPKRPGPLPGQQEIWGETGETDAAAPSIIQSWKIPGQPVGGWAGTASRMPQEEDLESISWEEIPPPALWVPDAPPPAAVPVLPPGSATSATSAAVSRGSPAIGEAGVPGPVPPAGVSAAVTAGTSPTEQVITAPTPGPATAPPSEAPKLVARAVEAAPVIRQPVPTPPVEPAPPFPAPEIPAAPPGAPEERPALPSAADFPDVLSGQDRDSIAAAALAALTRRFLRAAIFTAKPKVVSGWAATGEAVDLPKFRRLEIPWNEPSVFLNVRLSRAFYLGPL
ncbi:MAG TPA: hypothetical protein VLO07_07860, partial [Thermoanaerobaculia bacterium]|nr:hypothetical protein [Thermoanaerobaculia bacterium]